MQKAGGIIAIIAGIFGLLAAGATLLIGGVGSAFDAKDAGTVVGLGWGGVVFSFLVIILGAIAISAETKKIGTLLIVSSIAGAILGGTLVALFMVLSLIGGILATVSTKGSGKKEDKVSDGSSLTNNGADLRRTSRSVARQMEEVAVRQASAAVGPTPLAMDGHAEGGRQLDVASVEGTDAGREGGGAVGVTRAIAVRTKQCPFCAEEIKVEAKKCKHCGSALESLASSDALARDTADGQADGVAVARRGGAKLWIVGSVIAAVVAIVAVLVAWAFVGQSKGDHEAGVFAKEAADAGAVTVEPSHASEQQNVDAEANQAAAAASEQERQAAIDAYSQELQAERQPSSTADSGDCEGGASNMAEVYSCEFAKAEAAVDGAEMELRAALSRGGFSEQLIALRRSQEDWKSARDVDCQQVYDEAFKEGAGYAESNRLECIQTHNEGRVEELRAYAEVCSNGDRSACVVE